MKFLQGPWPLLPSWLPVPRPLHTTAAVARGTSDTSTAAPAHLLSLCLEEGSPEGHLV